MKTLDLIPDISSLGGDPIYVASAFLFLITKNYAEFWALTIAFVIIYGVTATIRFFWWKKRPDGQNYANWFEKLKSGAFPSLHAGRATALAITLIGFYENFFVTVVFIAGIIAVCVTRVMLKRHNPIDVLVGAIFGIVASAVAQQIINMLRIF
ncbi:TPA: phosphatase PAP2 family protein [archaeon]|uniref:Phosphatase PAP2 family protein n=1 Tax=Candidatus Naiadarchaeum limnaeum TaxID=2756139 RepID=A0A832UPB7_9ARCH|nr:phosphatase PAP2 family protein [Candidatus Naiadarchaeum limnaeum]